MAIDLQKIEIRKQSVIDLKKTSGLGADSKAQVVLALDYSGSMTTLYQKGVVQDTVERILPFGLAFDDNGEVDFYLFHDGVIPMPEPITLANLDGHINNKVIGKHQMGGTNYAPVLEKIYSDFTKSPSYDLPPAPAEKKSFFGFGKSTAPVMEKPVQTVKMKMPVYVIFITDGNNFDKDRTERIIRRMSNEGFFVQFIGIGWEQFQFLDKLDDLPGRLIDNVNFFKVDNIAQMSDQNLYQGLMNEYPGWVKQAKSLNLID